MSAWSDIVKLYPDAFSVYGLKSDGTFVFAGEIDEEFRVITDWKLFSSIDTLEQEIEENNAIMRKNIEKERRAARQKALEAEKERYVQMFQGLNRNLQRDREQLANLRGLFTGKKRRELEDQIANAERRMQDLQAQIADIEKELQEMQK